MKENFSQISKLRRKVCQQNRHRNKINAACKNTNINIKFHGNNLTLIETMQINSNLFSRCKLIFILLISKINVIPRMLEKMVSKHL